MTLGGLEKLKKVNSWLKQKLSKIRKTNRDSTKCIQKHTVSKVETYEYTIKLDQRQVLAQQAAP